MRNKCGDMRNNQSSADKELPDVWLYAILTTSILALALSAYGLMNNLTGITPHLFYIPIFLAIYRFQRNGFFLSLLLATLYLGMVYYFTYPNLMEITEGTIRYIVLLGVAGIVSYLVDRLNEQEKKYHSIFGNSQAGICLINLKEMRITEVNQRFCEILGYRMDELLATKLMYIWQSNLDADKFIRQLNSEGVVPNFESTFVTKSGRTRHTMLSAGMLSGSVAVCTMVDITERKRAEIMLRGANEFSGLLVHERDENNLLKKACIKLGSLRERFVVSIWLMKDGEVFPFTISDDTFGDILNDPEISLLIRKACETRAIMSRSAKPADDSGADEREQNEVLAIPMMAGGEVRGVLTVVRTSADPLSHDEIQLLSTLANDLASVLKLSELEDQKRQAYSQIDKNIEQFAILGDHIRNPLQVIVALACLDENPTSKRIIEQAYTIHGIVSELDSGWIESAMIRDFLKRHY